MIAPLQDRLASMSDDDQQKYIERQVLLEQLLRQSTLHATFDNLSRYDDGIVDRGEDSIVEDTGVVFLGVHRTGGGGALHLVGFRGRVSGMSSFGWIDPSAQMMQIHPVDELVFSLTDEEFDRLFAIKAEMDTRQRREAQTQPIDIVDAIIVDD